MPRMRVIAIAPALASALLGGLVCTTCATDLEGHVIQVAADAIYLDQGALDGLQLGDRIVLRDKSGTPIEMTVARLADHHAAVMPVSGDSSFGDRLTGGDTWTATSVTAKAGGSENTPRTLPRVAPVDLTDLDAAWKAALSAPAALRPYRPGDRAAYPAKLRTERWARVTPGVLIDPYRAGVSRNYAGGFLTLRGMTTLSESGAFRMNLDCDLQDWVTRPHPDRLRPSSNASVLLHAFALEYAPARAGLNVALGRNRLASAPGIPLLDGAALSWARGSASRGRLSPPVEMGIYGGYLPDPLTLDPSADRLSLGTFAAAAGSVTAGLAGSARGRLSLVRAKRVSQEDAQILVSLAAPSGTALDGGATVSRPPGKTRTTGAWAGLRARTGSSEVSVRWRQSQPVLDPTQVATVREVLGDLATSPGRTQRAEIGISAPVGGAGGRIEASLGRSSGTGGFDRWTADGRMAYPIRLGPLSRWVVAYRGSSGWQEGQEGELGLRLEIASWNVEVTAGGGEIHESKADHTTAIGRGIVSVRRPLGSAGMIDLLACGQGENHSLAATGRLAFSWRFLGGGR